MCMLIKNKSYVIKWSKGERTEAEKEAEYYKEAKEQSLEMFFPETELLAEIGGIKFVAQEKIDFCVAEVPESKNKKFQKVTKTPSLEIVQKMQKCFNKAGRSCHRNLDYTWAKMALSLYGKKRCKALCEFIIEHEINDLHYGNLGYKNNKPIILDFSGYESY